MNINYKDHFKVVRKHKSFEMSLTTSHNNSSNFFNSDEDED